MIRHILFWNYTEKVKEEHTQEESLRFMQQSVATMNGNIEGLLHAEITAILPVAMTLFFMQNLQMRNR